MTGFRPRTLTRIALCAALGFVLSFLKLKILPEGGSISFAPVPVFVLALVEGPRAGVLAGLILGLLKGMTGTIFAPVQGLLDYPVAYAALGFAGFVPSRPLLGGLFASGVRFVVHVLSGVLFFDLFVPAAASLTTTSKFLGSIGYNAVYMVPETMLALACLHLLARRGLLPERTPA